MQFWGSNVNVLLQFMIGLLQLPIYVDIYFCLFVISRHIYKMVSLGFGVNGLNLKSHFLL